MAISPCNSQAVTQLIAAGIIPPETLKFELVLDTKHACTIRLERYASESDLQVIADALIRNRDEFDIVTSPVSALDDTVADCGTTFHFHIHGAQDPQSTAKKVAEYLKSGTPTFKPYAH